MTGVAAAVLIILFIILAPVLRNSLWKLIVSLAGLSLVGTAIITWVLSNLQLVSDLIGRSVTLTGRLQLWAVCFYMALRQPWLGYGYSAFWLGLNGPSRIVWQIIRWHPPHPHNGLLSVWLDLGLIGAALLLAAPGAFRGVVPALILLAVALVLIQPYVARRRAKAGRVVEHPGPALQAGVFLTSIYGGYFGAAQGVIFLALLSLTLDDDLQRLNGVKNIIAAVVNGVAAVYFIAGHDVAWVAVLILVVASTIGGQLGAHYGRRIPANVLRIAIAVVGTGVAIKLLVD